MKWILMTLFFFSNLDRANADEFYASDIASISNTTPLLESDSPFEIMKDLYVFSLRIPPRFIYSAPWLENIDTDSPQLCQIGIKIHHNKQNVFANCDHTTHMEDL
ncbi:hypothetical protein K2X05_00910 [bacterium]|nr:hypothetical protein [bacterium]